MKQFNGFILDRNDLSKADEVAVQDARVFSLGVHTQNLASNFLRASEIDIELFNEVNNIVMGMASGDSNTAKAALKCLISFVTAHPVQFGQVVVKALSYNLIMVLPNEGLLTQLYNGLEHQTKLVEFVQSSAALAQLAYADEQKNKVIQACAVSAENAWQCFHEEYQSAVDSGDLGYTDDPEFNVLANELHKLFSALSKGE